MGRLNGAQRIVLVVALGVGLVVLGQFIERSLGVGAMGWVGYAPLGRGFVLPGDSPWGELFLWLVLTVTWATMSMVILRTRPLSAVPPVDRTSDASRSV
jgi:hypothetical protein